MDQAFARLLAPLARRIRLTASRAILKLVFDESELQQVQVKLLAEEIRNQVKRFQNYGLSSHPLAGAEGIYLSLGGSREAGVIICLDDGRYRPALKAGESALYDDLGQTVHLTRDGIVIKGAGLPVTITDTPSVTVKAQEKVRLETALLEVTGEIKDRCDESIGRTMSAMREVYDDHDHHENNQPNGNTNKTNQRMSS